MTANSSLTIPEKLLVSASRRWGQIGEIFSAEDLIVAAWTDFPDSFGLQGYVSDHPDSNRVLTNIMGSKGLRNKGWIKALGRKRYSLTAEGLRYGQSTDDSEQDSRQLRGSLDRRNQDALAKLITSTAYSKFTKPDASQLLFRDACVFWGITPRSVGEELRNKILDTERLLELTRSALGEGVNLSYGQGKVSTLDSADVDSLESLHRHLLSEFETELDSIRSRKRKYGKITRR